jgi:hypothetical protein
MHWYSHVEGLLLNDSGCCLVFVDCVQHSYTTTYLFSVDQNQQTDHIHWQMFEVRSVVTLHHHLSLSWISRSFCFFSSSAISSSASISASNLEIRLQQDVIVRKLLDGLVCPLLSGVLLESVPDSSGFVESFRSFFLFFALYCCIYTVMSALFGSKKFFF